MNVGAICTRKVVTMLPSDELVAAAELMREKHVGFLVVVEPDSADARAAPAAGAKPVGVLTDRDIVVGVISRKADPRDLRVGDVMTRRLILAEESRSVSSALILMRKNGVRRVPVVGPAGELIGVLSLDDVLEAFARELQDIAGSIRNEQRIESSVLNP